MWNKSFEAAASARASSNILPDFCVKDLPLKEPEASMAVPPGCLFLCYVAAFLDPDSGLAYVSHYSALVVTWQPVVAGIFSWPG